MFKTLNEVIAEETPAVRAKIKAAGRKLAAKRDAAVRSAKGKVETVSKLKTPSRAHA